MSRTAATMTCANHPDIKATVFCRFCGKALCAGCVRDNDGVTHCEDCLPVPEAGVGSETTPITDEAPHAPPLKAPSSVKARAGFQAPEVSAEAPSPLLAFILGLIPGVGAVYNGHYAKAVFHVVVFGGVMTLMGSGVLRGLDTLLMMFALMFFIYMPIEASRTAKALQRGEPVDEFSGLLSLVHAGSRLPAVGITLIVLGLAFLLQSLGYWRIPSLVPYWPVSLIALGIYMLYRRFSEPSRQNAADHPRRSEQLPGLSGLGASANRQSVPGGEPAVAPLSDDS